MNTEMNTEIMLEKYSAIELFNDGRDGLEKIVNKIKDEFDGVVFDVTTSVGRKQCASAAFKVARSKTALENMRKEAKDEHAKIVKAIDADGRWARDELQALQDEIRRPLDEWEAAEKERVALIHARISALNYDTQGMTADQIKEKIDEISAVSIDASFAEFELEAAKAKDSAMMILNAAFITTSAAEKAEAERVKAEAEAAELARIQRERQIAEEAAKRAIAEAEEKARAEAVRVENENARAEAEYQRQIAEARAEALRIAREAQEKARAEAARVEREREVERQRVENELALADQEAQRKIAAAQEEAARIRREVEEEERAADKQHRLVFNALAVDDIAALGFSVDAAKKIVSAIADGRIHAVKIIY